MKKENSRTRILLVDDHEVVRCGLRTLLETRADLEVCGEAADGAEAVRKSVELSPDIVVLDISMPEMDGLEAARRIVGQVPGVEVLMLSMHESDQTVRSVIAAGARGYMLKSDAGRELVAAVEALRERRPYFSLQLGRQKVVQNPKVAVAETAKGALTPREVEVTRLLAEGKSNKEAADVLSISVKTVETHRARVMRKLGLASFAELVRWAIRNHHVSA
jgi:DNA-binding NarL/FixJ family response regulator